MNIQSRHPTTPDEFLRWNERREGKREFVDGRVEELMINVTRNHAEIALNFAAELRARLDRKLFSLGSADFGVRTPKGIRYPDAFVDRRTSDSRGTDLAASEPILVAEVLSPSSYGRDFVDKLADYEGLGSLQHYIILSHEEPRAWLWSRGTDGAWPKIPQEIAGEEDAIDLSSLGVTIPMAELYAGIERRA